MTKRRKNDRYLTPAWATATLLEQAPEVRGGCLLDPCCGDGRMARALTDAGRFSAWLLNDIDPMADFGRPFVSSAHDATDPALYADARPDWVVTNPPFSASGRIAWAALQGARWGVALLLRITWLEPCAGREWLARLPPTRMIVMPRIDFVGAGSVDSATCAWFIWTRGADGAWQLGSVTVTTGQPGQGALLG